MSVTTSETEMTDQANQKIQEDQKTNGLQLIILIIATGLLLIVWSSIIWDSKLFSLGIGIFLVFIAPIALISGVVFGALMFYGLRVLIAKTTKKSEALGKLVITKLFIPAAVIAFVNLLGIIGFAYIFYYTNERFRNLFLPSTALILAGLIGAFIFYRQRALKGVIPIKSEVIGGLLIGLAVISLILPLILIWSIIGMW